LVALESATPFSDFHPNSLTVVKIGNGERNDATLVFSNTTTPA
jgi:hypothetical protein